MSEIHPVPVSLGVVVPDGWCEQQFMPWADSATDLDDVAQAEAYLSALIHAYERIDRDTRELQAAKLYTETRLGELLGPPIPGRPEKRFHRGTFGSLPAVSRFSKADRNRFRKLALHRQTVLDFIAATPRSENLTRAAVLREISRTTKAPAPAKTPSDDSQPDVLPPPATSPPKPEGGPGTVDALRRRVAELEAEVEALKGQRRLPDYPTADDITAVVRWLTARGAAYLAKLSDRDRATLAATLGSSNGQRPATPRPPAEAPRADNTACSHPRGQRNPRKYGTFCGACGVLLKTG